MTKVFFWQNIPSHIQSPAIEEFAKRWEGQVACVWESPITADRKSLSWTTPEMPSVKKHFIDSQNPQGYVRKFVGDTKNAIHIFSGMNAYPSISYAFRVAQQFGCKRLCLMVEPGISLGWRGLLRPIRARLIATKYKPSIKLLLAMGHKGFQFYQKAGFDPKIIFPYMYQAPVAFDTPHKRSVGKRQLIYVGKFDRRKGLDILLRAVSECECKNFTLRIVGGGIEEATLRQLNKMLHNESQVVWEGVRPHEEILKMLGESDLCIVPSRFEGWGVVTNEAIGMGTPVICSSSTTSRDLVEFGHAGLVFQTGDHRDLARKMSFFIDDPDALATAKENTMRYRHLIEAGIIANYLKEVLEYRFLNRSHAPLPPWKETPDSIRPLPRL